MSRRIIGVTVGTTQRPEAVLTRATNLTEEEKSQARANIGAPSQAEADFFHSRLTDGSLVLTDTKTADDDTLYVEKGELKLKERKVTFLTNEDEQRILDTVVRHDAWQELSQQQMDTARYNINAASVDQFDSLADTVNNMDADVADLTRTALRKDTEASVSSIKILHSPETSDAISVEGSVVEDKDSMLVNVLTLQGDFTGEIDLDSVIIRNVHDGVEPTDAVTLGQLNERFKEKVYEQIATITVAPNTDGSLPQYVTFTADSEGNPFELSDFIIIARAAFVAGSKSTLYMNVNNVAVIVNGQISSLGTTPRTFSIFFRSESDGCKRVEFTSSLSGTQVFNSQATIADSRLVPPFAGHNFDPITKVQLHTLLPTDGERAWVDGSTFELWGVRV